MDFTCRNRPAPHISKSLPPGFRKWLLGLADLSEGVCFLIEIVKRPNYRRFGNFKQQCVHGGSSWVGRPYMFMTLGSWICGVQTAGNRDDAQPLLSETHTRVCSCICVQLACMHIWWYVCIYVHIYRHTCQHICMHASIHAYMLLFIYIYLYKNIFTCKYIHIFIYTYIYIYTHIYTYTYIYIYIYIYE